MGIFDIVSVSEIIGEIDYPTTNSQIKTSPLNVQGWALSNDGTELEISIFLDEKLEKQTQNTLPRFDIEKKIQDIPNAYESGFVSTVDLGKLNLGTHMIEVIAKNENIEKSLGKVNFELVEKDKHIVDVVPTSPDFKKSGQNYFNRILVGIAGIKPEDDVLDVGCGIGRLAVPATKYLNDKGSYKGFDISPTGISWCKKHISSKYPNFEFLRIDIFNNHYNRNGKIDPSKFKFPFENESFDLVFLASIFTHILPNDLKNYLSEISRVLKKGGKICCTIKLLNDESTKLVDSGLGEDPFPFKFEHFRSTNKERPEASIIYDEKFVKEVYEKNNLEIKHFEPGGWCGRKKGTYSQDVLLAQKCK